MKKRMNPLVKVEKWIYTHFGFSLPSWRRYWKHYCNTIQRELNENALNKRIDDYIEESKGAKSVNILRGTL